MKSAIRSFRVQAGTERKKWLSKQETRALKRLWMTDNASEIGRLQKLNTKRGVLNEFLQTS